MRERFGYPVVAFPPEGISSAESAIKFLVDQLVRSGRLAMEHAAPVCTKLLRRESLGSTAFGRGVAMPHCMSYEVNQPLGIVGESEAPIPWAGSLDGRPVHLACLLLTPGTDRGAGIRALETLARRLAGG
jgi:mannitol/fructose-specific phosphotransferase system IIA component (Ntr-type)